MSSRLTKAKYPAKAFGLQGLREWVCGKDSETRQGLVAPATVRFDTFFVTSSNRWGYRGLAHAREVLGWEPLDRAEDYR